MKFFDTHTHLNADEFKGSEEEYVRRAKAAHVAYMCVVGFDEETIEGTLRLNQTFSNIISAVGWHPTEAETYTPEIEKKLEMWLAQPKVRMLGEIGLDYYWDTARPEVQANVFRRQIAIAKNLHLPITIHNRDATADVYKILKEEGLPHEGGIMHSFGGTPEEAAQFLDLGMHISFSGVLTFKKSEKVRDAMLVVPDNRLLIETDAPYLAPVPYRGKRNEPAYVIEVAKMMSEVRGVPLEMIAHMTTQNAFELFKWYPEGEN